MVCVFNIKLGFMDWFYYNLVIIIIIIKKYKISYKNSDKALLCSRNQVFCPKNWKPWRVRTTTELINFCWKFACVTDLPYPCVKSVRIASYSGLYFRAFGLNTERYGVSSRIQSEWGEMRTRITPNTDSFRAVYVSNLTYVHNRVFGILFIIFRSWFICKN